MMSVFRALGFRDKRFILVFLSYPVLLAFVFLGLELPGLIGPDLGTVDEMPQDYRPSLVSLMAAYSFEAFRWLVFPARVIHNWVYGNPYWMRPGATLHHGQQDLWWAFLVSVAVWSVVVLAVRTIFHLLLWGENGARWDE